MQGRWSQVLLGGILGAGLWSGLSGFATPATPPSEPVAIQAESPLPSESPEALPTVQPQAVATPLPPAPSPSPAEVPAEPPPPLPILRGTLVGTSRCAILEYQGVQRVVHEGEGVGPFVVGGVYPKQASVALRGEKFFLPLVPQPPASSTPPSGPPKPAAATPKVEADADIWIKGLAVTQVERDGTAVGLLIHRAGVSVSTPQDGPLSQFGVYDDDVVKAVNGHDLRTEADLWWLHEELLHSPSLEIAMERGGVNETLRQNRERQ